MLLVALMGLGREPDRRKSHEAGFDGHLVKPVDYAEVERLVVDGTTGLAQPPGLPTARS